MVILTMFLGKMVRDYEAALWLCASATSGAVFSAELGDAETQGNAEVRI